MHTWRLSFGLGLTLLAACGNPDPSQIKRGVYRLTMVKVSDTCTPARLSGDQGEAPLDPRAASVGIPIPQGDTSTASHPLAFVQVPAAQPLIQRVLDPDCSAHSTSSLELRSVSNPVEVRYLESWTGVTTCTNSHTKINGRPQTDCDAETLLRYTRVLECESPCILRAVNDSGSIHYECVCQ